MRRYLSTCLGDRARVDFKNFPDYYFVENKEGNKGEFVLSNEEIIKLLDKLEKQKIPHFENT